MVIFACSDFEGMCNFRPVSQIHAYLSEWKPLADLCGGQETKDALDHASSPEAKRDSLRKAFSSLMTADAAAIKSALNSMEKDIRSKQDQTDADELFLRLCSYYPGDVGCFSSYLLNFLRIKPGQAFFMAANEPHAYLKGQCMEIMANSDNVVRAGLTPKFKDVDNLIDMLTYKDGPPKIMDGERIDEYTTVYQPPAEEFQLTRYVVPVGKAHEMTPAKGVGLVLCLAGCGWIRLQNNSEKRMPLAPGSLYYVPEGAPITVYSEASAIDEAKSPDLAVFRAGINQS